MDARRPARGVSHRKLENGWCIPLTCVYYIPAYSHISDFQTVQPGGGGFEVQTILQTCCAQLAYDSPQPNWRLAVALVVLSLLTAGLIALVYLVQFHGHWTRTPYLPSAQHKVFTEVFCSVLEVEALSKRRRRAKTLPSKTIGALPNGNRSNLGSSK